MLKNGINPYEVNVLDRLAIVGNSGMGALTYRPTMSFDKPYNDKDLDDIAKQCEDILNDNFCDDLDYIFSKGGSSGGAKPKILTRVENEDWIIKFPSSYDDKNIGKQEYDYALCARECGIDIEEVKLFPSKNCPGYFGIKRFDRKNGKKVHMISASGLLETSHRIPNLDYDILMKLTLKLTGSMEECEKLYRLMCFNVFVHNRDDHSKNFSFLYDEEEKRWTLSPAYDLTYSNSIGGEHATTVNGNGKDPTIDDILSVASKIGLNMNKSKSIVLNIKDCVTKMLHEYL